MIPGKLGETKDYVIAAVSVKIRIVGYMFLIK